MLMSNLNNNALAAANEISGETETLKNTAVGRIEEMKKIKVKVEGMGCQNCADGIKASLLDRDGIISVKSDYNSKTFKIKFDDRKIDSEQILSIIEELGYKPAILSD